VVADAFVAEARSLEAALSAASEEEFDLPTRCAPWRVRDLLAHVGAAVHRVPEMLAAPAPEAATTGAAGYYRRDRRFAPDVDGARVAGAVEAATRTGSGAALVTRFGESYRATVEAVAAVPADRVVLTRHGDAMLLTDFMITRVVELALHGLDLSDALSRGSWIRPTSTDLLLTLLFPGRAFPWDGETTLRRATGRAEVTAEDRAALREAGLRSLTLSAA
jgi:uncharacterized protein (TIGR03083 family)